MNDSEPDVLRVAYMPLIDCAPLVAASRLGLDLQYGVRLQLQRQASWAAVRDRLVSGEVDAAHLLGSLVHAIELGIAGPQAPMAWLLTLNQNGQAITLSTPLAHALQSGQALPVALATAGRRVVFAQTFPTGTHALWLYDWLAASGVDPMREVGLVSLPPQSMPDALAAGDIDGYCSGEPWADAAEARSIGLRVVRSGERWPAHPEKVLACRRDLAALQPERVEQLTACVLAACRWLDADPANRATCAAWLAEEAVIGAPVDRLVACLQASPNDPAALAFHRHGAVNFPWLSDGQWFVGQFARWGWCQPDAVSEAHLRDIHRLETYRAAAARIGVTAPAQDWRDVAPAAP
ncbi:MAG TPA: CmpA/NrtA family ABC transporter substrate-binding protein [Stenotrophomonas sp.]|jgi:nitrate/nitrite transport system substrate-binding protein